MFDELTDLYQQLILDHSKNPRNFHVMDDADHEAQGTNPMCGDNYRLFVKMDGDTVTDVSFQGSGCAISKASASLLTESLKGKNRDEIKGVFEKVRQMVTTGEVTDTGIKKLSAFAGVHKFPARVKCAILPWHAIVAAVEGDQDSVSTE